MIRTAAALAVAVAMWGLPNGCNSVTAERVALPRPILGQATMGQGCAVKFSTRIRKQKTLCFVLKHEVGHLHGVPHSNMFGDIMRPVLQLPVTKPYCRRNS